MKTKIHLLFPLLLGVMTGPILWAQPPAKAVKRYAIPFTLNKHNTICVQTLLNGKDRVLLMLHTATSAVTLTEEGSRKTGSVHFTRTDTVSSWGGNDNTSRYSDSNRVQIGPLVRENIPVWENRNSGPGTDGKFGLDVFDGQVVQISFSRKRIFVSPDLPANLKHYYKLKLVTKDDQLFVEAACEIGQNAYINSFLIHSGYSGGLLLDDAFTTQFNLAQKLKITETQELKDAYGGIVKVQKAVLPTFIIAGQRLPDIPVGFFEGAVGRQKMSVMGSEVLKRFDWILDAKREYVYLKPNSRAS